jgi:hypothetical protein
LFFDFLCLGNSTEKIKLLEKDLLHEQSNLKESKERHELLERKIVILEDHFRELSEKEHELDPNFDKSKSEEFMNAHEKVISPSGVSLCV